MFINAFILGGILCALFQVFMIFTKLDPPRILILGFTLGALLSPYGMMDALSQWGCGTADYGYGRGKRGVRCDNGTSPRKFHTHSDLTMYLYNTNSYRNSSRVSALCRH